MTEIDDVAIEAVHEMLDALEPIIRLAIQHDRLEAEHHLRKLGLVGGTDNFAPIEKMLLCGCSDELNQESAE